MLRTIWLLPLLATFATAFVCPHNFCDTVKCANVQSCQNGYIKQRGGTCGCCNTCITYIDEGDSCWAHFLRGTPLKSDCRPGFYCSKVTHTCQKSEFNDLPVRDLKKIHKSCTDLPKVDGKYQACDDDGQFKPKQCEYSQTGSTNKQRCFCAHKDGHLLGNYIFDRSREGDTDCFCAREEDFLLSSGAVGKTVSCDKIGNYRNTQCLGSGCYCVDPKTGNRIGNVVHISQKQTLNC